MVEVRSYHVVTYVDRFGVGGEELEPLAFATLQAPEGNADGEASEATLDSVQNYQCGGDGAGTDGCTRAHAHAVERVLARMGAEGRARVTWRRFHPRIGVGDASPGKPFLATSPVDGTRVRIEVREIDTADGGDTQTDARLSPAALERFEAELGQRQLAAQPRVQIYEHAKNFEHSIGPTRAKIERLAVALQDLPEQEAIQRTIARARDTIETVAGEIMGGARELLAGSPENAFAFVEQVQAGTQAVNAAVAEVTGIRAQFEEIVRIQAQLRGKIAKVEEVATMIEVAANILDIEPPMDSGPLLEGLRELLEYTRQGAHHEEINELQQRVAGYENDCAALDRIGKVLDVKIERRKEEFSTRVWRVQGWHNGQKEKDVLRWIGQGQGYPGFAVHYWGEEAKKAVAQAAKSMPAIDAIGDLVFEDRAHHDKLRELEGMEQSLLAEFGARVTREFARRAQGAFHSLEVGGLRFEVPYASVRVLERHGDLLHVEIDIRNQDEKPILVSCQGENGVNKQVLLAEKGEIAVFSLEDVEAPVTFRVLGVGQEPVGNDGDVLLHILDVRSGPVAITRPGAHQYAAPAAYVVKGYLPGATETRNPTLDPRTPGVWHGHQDIPGDLVAPADSSRS